MKPRPILMLEVNEVPFRVFKKYSEDPRYPNLRKLVSESKFFETKLTDPGELSPWCTWPTIHRGLKKADHAIHHLGQDPTTFRGTPIWDEYRAKGFSVGIFGSMQSWPAKDPGENGFYVPDTFSASSECVPGWLEPIQKFNLGLVRENGRVMNDNLASRAFNFQLLLSLLRAGIRLSTASRAAAHLVRERLKPAMRARRVSFQALLFWDIFRKLYNVDNPPAFATFFTNHIAAVEHRFWNHIFPEDFPESARPRGREHLATMEFAVEVLDGILGEAFSWREKNPNILLLVVNCMGQEAKVRERHQGFELMLKKHDKLFEMLGIPKGVKHNLAMAPQIAYDLEGLISPEKFQQLLSTVRTRKGSLIFTSSNHNNTVSVNLITPFVDEITDNKIMVNGKEVHIEDVGIVRFAIDAGTAYHIPEGLIFAHGLKNEASPKQAPLPAEKVKHQILEWGGML